MAPFCSALAVTVVSWVFLSDSQSTLSQMHVAAHQGVMVHQLAQQPVRGGQEQVEVQVLMEDFERSVAVLEVGGALNGRRIEAAPADIRPVLAEQRVHWNQTRSILRTLVDSPEDSPGFRRGGLELPAAIQALSGSSDRLAEALEAHAEVRRLQLFWVLVVAAFVNLVVLLIGLWYARGSIIRPVLDVARGAQQVLVGDYSVRLACTTGDELCHLAETFNQMTARLEALVKESAQRHRHAELLVQSLPWGMALLDERLVPLHTNASFLAMFDLGESASSAPITEQLPSGEFAELAREVVRTGRDRRAVLSPWRGHDGVLRFQRVSLVAIPAIMDAEARLLIAVEDLTEEERLRGQAVAAEQRFRQVIEQATDGIVITDQAGRVTDFNHAAELLFDYRSADCVGKPLATLLPAHEPEDEGLPPVSGEFTGEGFWGRDAVVQQMGLRRGGSTIPLECTQTACVIDGEMTWIHILRDITPRLRFERALRRSEQSFRQLIESVPDAIAVHREGMFVYVNPSMVRMLGYGSHRELIGKPVPMVVHPDDHALVAERIGVMATTGAMLPLAEERFVRKDGSVVHAEVVALPIEYKGAPSFVAIGRDVSERREFLARAMQMDRMIAVGTLAAGVGHEINNPLTYVTGNVSFALDRLGEVRSFVDRLRLQLRAELGVQRSAALLEACGEAQGSSALLEMGAVLVDARSGGERIRDIVRDLKTFSRGDEDTREPLQLHGVIGSAIDMSFNEVRHCARLVKDYGEVPLVLGNVSRLGQVFLNLLVNAAHAMDQGAADRNELRVRTFTQGDEAVVEIRDTGHGIRPEDMSRLFDPFFTTKPVGQGTGLGLSISRQTVEQYGGRIEVESEVGRGTVFRIVLPAFQEAPESSPESVVPTAEGARRGRILVVDDEPGIGRIVQRMLRAEELEVEVLLAGRLALARIEAGERFDLILCDLMMPDMTGIDLYEVLMERFPDQARVMIFVTGGAFTTRAKAFLDRVSNLRVDKPFDARNLRALVRELLKSTGD